MAIRYTGGGCFRISDRPLYKGDKYSGHLEDQLLKRPDFEKVAKAKTSAKAPKDKE